MAKKSKGQTTIHVPVCGVRGKKTSQGRRYATRLWFKQRNGD